MCVCVVHGSIKKLAFLAGYIYKYNITFFIIIIKNKACARVCVVYKIWYPGFQNKMFHAKLLCAKGGNPEFLKTLTGQVKGIPRTSLDFDLSYSLLQDAHRLDNVLPSPYTTNDMESFVVHGDVTSLNAHNRFHEVIRSAIRSFAIPSRRSERMRSISKRRAVGFKILLVIDYPNISPLTGIKIYRSIFTVLNTNFEYDKTSSPLITRVNFKLQSKLVIFFNEDEFIFESATHKFTLEKLTLKSRGGVDVSNSPGLDVFTTALTKLFVIAHSLKDLSKDFIVNVELNWESIDVIGWLYGVLAASNFPYVRNRISLDLASHPDVTLIDVIQKFSTPMGISAIKSGLILFSIRTSNANFIPVLENNTQSGDLSGVPFSSYNARDNEDVKVIKTDIHYARIKKAERKESDESMSRFRVSIDLLHNGFPLHGVCVKSGIFHNTVKIKMIETPTLAKRHKGMG